MSSLSLFFILAAIELGGLFLIYYLLKARISRYLELENLLEGVREEARALVLELNETADRSVSLVEDRMVALRSLLDEVDRRIGVQKREIQTRENEREVYARLNKRRPIVPEPPLPMAQSSPLPPEPAAVSTVDLAQAEPLRAVAAREAPIPLSLGSESQGSRALPEVRISEEPVATGKTKREEALDLHRRGISADLIAARLGATVAEIELLVELEERRQANSGGAF